MDKLTPIEIAASSGRNVKRGIGRSVPVSRGDVRFFMAKYSAWGRA